MLLFLFHVCYLIFGTLVSSLGSLGHVRYKYVPCFVWCVLSGKENSLEGEKCECEGDFSSLWNCSLCIQLFLRTYWKFSPRWTVTWRLQCAPAQPTIGEECTPACLTCSHSLHCLWERWPLRRGSVWQLRREQSPALHHSEFLWHYLWFKQNVVWAYKLHVSFLILFCTINLINYLRKEV